MIRRHLALQLTGQKLFATGMGALVLALGCGTNGGESTGSGGAAGAGGNASGGNGSGGDASGSSPGSGGENDGSGGDPGPSTGGSDPLSEACHSPSDAGELTTKLPCLLSETGLYAADMETLGEGVRPFEPIFPLWTDSAAKKRWIRLPAGTQIDTAEMDFWSFPAGTKLWKEFARDGVRVETRLIEKQESGAWYMVAYQWREPQTDADAVPNGVANAKGTEHDIPDTDACTRCHAEQPDKVLGFSAIQLSHDPVTASDPNEWTMQRLIDADLLTAAPAQPFAVPGTETERNFFGYVHGNCGHCHNPTSSATLKTGLDLWLKVADLDGEVSAFSVYQNIVDQDIGWADGERPPAPKRIAPTSLQDSAIYQRFLTKGQVWSMPPLGTEVTDPAGQEVMETWIQSLN